MNEKQLAENIEVIDDVEGHLRRVPVVEETDDVEGHRRVPVFEEDDDVEGHVQPPSSQGDLGDLASRS